MKLMHALFNTKYRMLMVGIYFFVLLLSASCKKESDPGPVVITPEEIAPEQRMKVLEACEEKLTLLQGKTPEEVKQELLAWLRAQPDFLEVGFDDDAQNAWAIFKDGRFVMFVNKNGTGSSLEDIDQKTSSDQYSKSSIVEGRSKELPHQKRALLFSALGTNFLDFRFIIKGYFRKAKSAYFPEEKRATIDELKSVTEETAIFYLYTHGGKAKLKDSLKFNNVTIPIAFSGLWTDDRVSAASDNKYRDDLDSHQLGYMIAYYDKGPFGNPIAERHYAITDKFIKRYMSFGENALIYIDGCGSFNTSLDRAFRVKAKKSAATYVGWTAPVYDNDAYFATTFFFDRMLGANDIDVPRLPKENPDQRPFPIDNVMRDLKNKGMGTSMYKGVTAILEFSSSGQLDPLILVPSISYLDIDEYQSKLTVYGIFGEDPRQNGGGEVIVNEQPVNSIDSWQKDKIVCTIPHKGKGAAGDVIVKARGHQSNAVPLTEWYIDFVWSEAGQKVKREAKITLHLRADVHRYRNYAGEKDPNRPDDADLNDAFPNNAFAKDSKAVLTARGSCSYTCPCNPGQVTHTHTKEGPDSVNLPYNLEGTSALNSFFAIYGWNSDRTEVQAFVTGADLTSFQEKVVSGSCTGAGSTISKPEPFAFLIADGLSEQPLKLQLANAHGFDFRINAGEKMFGTIAYEYCECFGGSPEIQQRLTWKESKPRFAPTDKTAARGR